MLSPMLRRTFATAASVVLVTLMLVACTGAGTSTSAKDGQSSQASASSKETTAGDLPDIESDFPLACETVTTAELVGVVGNPLSDGTGFTNLICDWGSDAEQTSVSLLLQPVPAEFCTAGLPEGESTDQFGSAGSIGYDDLLNIPGAQVGVCVDAGLVLVTVTGGYGAASDEARYTSEAVEVMELVLRRL